VAMVSRAPRVSVLLPIRDGEKYLHETLQSLFDQTMADWELIAVFDGSQDRSEAIVRSYSDRRIRIESIPTSVGMSAALNRGLALCRAEYVARIDADDLCMPHRLERQVSTLEREPGLGVLGTGAMLIDKASRVVGVRRVATGRQRVARGLLLRNQLVHPSVMFRRALVSSIDGYNPALPVVQDYELWLRLLAITEIDNLPDCLVSYRHHPDQLSLGRTFEWTSVAAIGRARQLAAPHVGVAPFGARLRGALFVGGQLRWEYRRRVRRRRSG
jgi:glycosyltransferase involved in cell wall biosynthesis